MSEASEVLVSREGAIVTLIINRPRAKNSLNRAVFDGLRAQLVQLRDDDAVRAVIITGAEGVFCAGADITAFDSLRAEPLLGDRAAAGGHFWAELERFPKPVIAAVEKLALGGGTELALACDIAIAGESTKFGVPEVKLGAIPGPGHPASDPCHRQVQGYGPAADRRFHRRPQSLRCGHGRRGDG